MSEIPFAENDILKWITKTEKTNACTLEYLSAFSAELPVQLSFWGLETVPCHPLATRQAECKASSKLNNLTSAQILAAMPAVSTVANTSLGCSLSHAMAGQYCFLQWKSQPSSELDCVFPTQGKVKVGFLKAAWQYE